MDMYLLYITLCMILYGCIMIGLFSETHEFYTLGNYYTHRGNVPHYNINYYDDVITGELAFQLLLLHNV